MIFEDIDDVEEWLEPLSYIEFWEAVAPYNLTLQDRDHCDDLITKGEITTDLALDVLKGLTVQELRRAFGLKDRAFHPPYISVQ